jgi:hypothetical protein
VEPTVEELSEAVYHMPCGKEYLPQGILLIACPG